MGLRRVSNSTIKVVGFALMVMLFQNCGGSNDSTTIPYGSGDSSTTPSTTVSPSSSSTSSTTSFPIAVVTSCTLPSAAASGTYTTTSDITYETVSGTNLNLDLYYPSSATTTPPLVIQIHGGGWSSGDKTDANQVNNAEVLVGLGYAVAVINYRLPSGSTNQFPAAIQDARCAVRWLKANAATYNYDNTHILAMGFAEGAYLAAMLGTAATNTTDGFDSTSCTETGETPAVNGVAAYYGMMNYSDSSGCGSGTTCNNIVTLFLGSGWTTNSAQNDIASPLNFVSSSTPPFFIAHGENDTTTPLVQEVEMDQQLQSNSIGVNYLEVQSVGHDFYPFDSTIATEVQTSSCTLLSYISAVFSQ